MYGLFPLDHLRCFASWIGSWICALQKRLFTLVAVITHLLFMMKYLLIAQDFDGTRIWGFSKSINFCMNFVGWRNWWYRNFLHLGNYNLKLDDWLGLRRYYVEICENRRKLIIWKLCEREWGRRTFTEMAHPPLSSTKNYLLGLYSSHGLL